MMQNDIIQNVNAVRQQIAQGNAFQEKVYLVAAIKTQSIQAVNAAIAAGVDAVAENKPQDFRDKNALIDPCPRHFIGHLQTNKVKYLVGNVELFHSCDRDELAEEIAKQSIKKGIESNVLIQINIGEETTKGGLILAGAAKEKPQIAEVVAVGPGGYIDGHEVTMYVNVGDKVLSSKFAGNEVKVDGVEYIILHQSDILAIVE